MKKFIGTKEFYLSVISIALPIMAQQFVTSFVNLIDNIMIGNVGSIALSSVTVSNRIYLIFNSTLFGLSGAAGIFIAQHYGAKNHQNTQKILNINLVASLIVSLIFMIAIYFFPKQLLSIFSNNPIIIKEGLSYLKYALYAYLPYSISMSIMMALRAVGINKIQLGVGIISVCTNTTLNYLLIFGHFGFPKLGIAGAAIATSIARLLEAIIYIIILLKEKHYFKFDLYGLFHLDKKMIAVMVNKAIPLCMNEIFYSTALSIIFIAYSRCDESLIPAISVVDTVMQIAFIIFSGLSSSVSIMIGNELGANRLKKAKDNSLKLIAFGIFIGLFISSIVFLVAPFIANYYNVEDFVKETIVSLLRVKSCLLPIYVYNVCVFFVLRAGGEAFSTLILDSGFLWVANVSISLILSFSFSIPLVLMYTIVECLDIPKLLLATYFYKKGKWLKNMTI